LISYGVLDHLIKPYPIREISDQTRSYFQANWHTIEPILLKKLEVHKAGGTLSRKWDAIQADLTAINEKLLGGV
jgi:hypothetical protein